jgi:hypothetical protein
VTTNKATDLAAVTAKVYDILKVLSSEEKQKVVSAVMTLFGENAPTGAAILTGGSGANSGQSAAGGKFSKSLATHLSEKQATSNQTLRFLATADWLRQKGQGPLTSTAVAQALKNNHQNRLANPADCLNKNAAKGFVEKDGKTFFITPEGLAHLGHQAS